MAEIDPSLPIPLFYQLKNLVFEDIVSGKYGPGDRLPTEHELCERYGISRTPIHRALSELADEGVIIRTRRKGSFVSPHWVPTRAAGDELRVTVTKESLVEPITESAAAPHRVNIAVTDYAELRHTLLGAIAEGRAPDVALIDETLIADFAEAGFLLPLDDLDPGWFNDEYRDDFVEPFVAGRMYGGSVYAVPEEVNVAGLWCSREALDSVGAQVPTTWAELEATARALQEELAPDVRAFAMPGGHVGGETTTYCLLAILASNGVEIIDDVVRLASSPAIDALQMLRRFIDGAAMSGDVVTYDWLRCPGLLGAKKVAVTVGGTYEADVIAAAAGIGLDEVHDHFAFAPFPAGPVGSPATVAGGMVYVVFRQTRYPKEALELLERIITTDRLIDRARGQATIPPRHSAIEAMDSPFITQAAEMFSTAITRPIVPDYHLISTQLQNMVETVLTGQYAPSAAAERTAEVIAAITGLPLDDGTQH
jgi:multiple sugar transport system substrate-binding protein